MQHYFQLWFHEQSFGMERLSWSREDKIGEGPGWVQNPKGSDMSRKIDHSFTIEQTLCFDLPLLYCHQLLFFPPSNGDRFCSSLLTSQRPSCDLRAQHAGPGAFVLTRNYQGCIMRMAVRV